MPFDHETEANEQPRRVELVFRSGRPKKGELPMPPSAYIAMGWYTADDDGAPRLTTDTVSYEELKAQVENLKAQLDACLGQAKAQFDEAKARGV